MNTLNLTVSKLIKGCRVYADGRQIALKRNKDGTFGGVYTTDRDEAEVTVVKLSEFGCKLWFLWAMLFFVISCFGIFNAHYDNPYITVNYRSAVKLGGQNSLRLEFNGFAEGQPALAQQSDCPIENSVNIFGLDKQAKKRRKIVILTEVFLWLALIVIVAIIVIKKVIGF